MDEIRKLMKRLAVPADKRIRLKDYRTDWTGSIKEARAKVILAEGIEQLAKQQAKLYAQDTYAVLVIFQAMDAAGKDSAIRHVMSGINPQGCQVFSFKAPSAEERDHDYLWRSVKALPERGRIGIHNRSHYEEVLIARVHKEILASQQLPESLKGSGIWKRRFREIRHFEQYLADNGTVIVKFFLHVSKEEQRRRFLDRIDEADKNWKFSIGDVKERTSWGRYMDAYEDMLSHTSTEAAPWYVVPADHKWFTRLAVAGILWQTMADLKLKYPTVTDAKKRELRSVRKILLAERD
ncbi:MAG TPA: polyphosphate kinase 2 family protein [Vicinamibacterales bacterium]|jgi:PPK2 family polyphosphate:nucleotide phosphotransferase|nr:polyphosphate kinase 2 family protein [Vicinamibacterales bacterium]